MPVACQVQAIAGPFIIERIENANVRKSSPGAARRSTAWIFGADRQCRSSVGIFGTDL